MNQTMLNQLVNDCTQSLFILRDYIESNWNGWDKDWAIDQVYNAVTNIKRLIPTEENEDGK